MLQGGCTTPISALAQIEENQLHFRGNLFSLDGKRKFEVEKKINIELSQETGIKAAKEILEMGGNEIIDIITNAKK